MKWIIKWINKYINKYEGKDTAHGWNFGEFYLCLLPIVLCLTNYSLKSFTDSDSVFLGTL